MTGKYFPFRTNDANCFNLHNPTLTPVLHLIYFVEITVSLFENFIEYNIANLKSFINIFGTVLITKKKIFIKNLQAI
jgi:hypothetical protein